MFSRSIYLYNTVSHIVAQFAAFWCIQLPIPSAVSTIQYNLKRQNEHFSKVALSSRVIFHQQQYWRTPYLNSFIILPNWIYPCQISHFLCLCALFSALAELNRMFSWTFLTTCCSSVCQNVLYPQHKFGERAIALLNSNLAFELS